MKHQAGAFTGMAEMVALLMLAVFAVALCTAISRSASAKEAAAVVLIGGALTVAIKLASFPFLPLRSAGFVTSA